MSRKPKIPPFWKQCFVTAAVGSNNISNGCAIGFPAVLVPQLLRSGSEINTSAEQASWIVSILAFTQLMGSLLTPPLMSRIGRRATHLVVSVLLLIGWFLVTLATSFEALFIGRFFQGLAIGVFSPLRSVLIGEYASPKYRGAFLTTISLTQSLGIFFAHLVGSFLSWQQTALVCVFFPFASLVMTLYSPESPSWLVSKGRYDECRKVFRWLRGDDEEDELEEMIEGQISIKNENKLKNNTNQMNRFESIIATIQKKEFYKPITIMFHAYVMIQFAGGTIIAAYSTIVIGLIMGPGVNANFWMIVLDTHRLIVNSIAVFVINKFKRRTILFLIGGLCVFSQLAIAAYTYSKTYGYFHYDAIWLPALLINVQYFTVASGMLPLPHVIGGEVFPLEYRSIGSTICLVSLSASFFLVLKTFITLVSNIGIYGAYVVYSGALAYCLVVIWFMLPETKGRTLQQIEDEFRGRQPMLVEQKANMSSGACPVQSQKRKMSRQDSEPFLL